MSPFGWECLLLSSAADRQEAAAVICTRFEQRQGRLILLMGHGTPHEANSVYAAFEQLCHSQGRRDLFVGTVEGCPALRMCSLPCGALDAAAFCLRP